MRVSKAIRAITSRCIAFLFVLSFFSCQEDDAIVQSLFGLSGAPLSYDDSNASRHLNIVGVSMICSKDKEENLEAICQKAIDAKSSYPETDSAYPYMHVLGKDKCKTVSKDVAFFQFLR